MNKLTGKQVKDKVAMIMFSKYGKKRAIEQCEDLIEEYKEDLENDTNNIKIDFHIGEIKYWEKVKKKLKSIRKDE